MNNNFTIKKAILDLSSLLCFVPISKTPSTATLFIVFYSWQDGNHTVMDALLFVMKAMTTSGVPEVMNSKLAIFTLGYLPVSVFLWAEFMDAILNRRIEESPSK